LLIGRKSLKSGKIEDGEIRDDENDIGIADYEKFFLNYINRCAVSLHSANLIINKATVEIANTYQFQIYRINSGSFFNIYF
jgi:hypothetical protein